MCVGLSARVVRLQTDGTAIVDASGARREISAQLLEEDDEESDEVLGSLF